MAATSIVILKAGGLAKTGLIGSYTFMLIWGLILFAIGEKLPIWNRFIGGGFVMAFFGGAVMVKLGLISAAEVKIMTYDAIGNRFLYFCLILLIGGNLLAVKRKTLMKSLVGDIPIILFGVAGASAMGILGGLLFGVAPARIITHYVLPIMGGGNGAGAIPMAEIYESVTGIPQQHYYSFAIAIGVGTDLQELIDAVTFSNVILCMFIIFGAILGTALPSRLFKFYEIEASLTAGLCMANRGGSGDLEVLGAAKRMELYPFAQISSRIGGGIVLVLAGYLFSVFLL